MYTFWKRQMNGTRPHGTIDDSQRTVRSMPSFDHAARIFLGLSKVRGIGFKTLRDAGGVDEVFKLWTEQGVEETLRALGIHAEAKTTASDVENFGDHLVELLRRKGVHLLRRLDPLYPAAFYDLPERNQPLWLFLRGDPEALATRGVTIVGTRSPTEVGRFLAQYAVTSLRDMSVCTVSGLAAGIDEAVHEWSLVCSVRTISVLGTGILRTYPASNAALADAIVSSGGALISEYLPEAPPTGESFVWRNRLQAALGSCLIAPEWKASSGTAHTVRFAKAMDRPTANLSMGIASPDAGVCDESFSIPLEHDSFRSFVANALKRSGSNGSAPVYQMGLGI
jgi:DNA processing protein